MNMMNKINDMNTAMELGNFNLLLKKVTMGNNKIENKNENNKGITTCCVSYRKRTTMVILKSISATLA